MTGLPSSVPKEGGIPLSAKPIVLQERLIGHSMQILCERRCT